MDFEDVQSVKSSTTDELLSTAIAECLSSSNSGLIMPICRLFESLEKKNEMFLISRLVEALTPLGLNPESGFYGWKSEPPKEELILELCKFQEEILEDEKVNSQFTMFTNFEQS
ncbi:hypothetical protein pv_299 [Pithovirus sibericum]|uniref:Uncharacterized protein n=1 Tax=Pithovirus sibericum TaxID=1450746 RepID=W5S566_9VIRU|nr:hypothetical protein pv_299 [Pithovirus sibericum]AHH01866.1 hypothetical protein pv_299 [Pithovirus sibericum]